MFYFYRTCEWTFHKLEFSELHSKFSFGGIEIWKPGKKIDKNKNNTKTLQIYELRMNLRLDLPVDGQFKQKNKNREESVSYTAKLRKNWKEKVNEYKTKKKTNKQTKQIDAFQPPQHHYQQQQHRRSEK